MFSVDTGEREVINGTGGTPWSAGLWCVANARLQGESWGTVLCLGE